MAGIVQPDAHDVLMRRIGYSVALEPVPIRIRDLIVAYAETGELDRATWYRLTKEWEMPSGTHDGKKKRAEHFLDVVTALGYTSQVGQMVAPQPPLEAGAIVYKALNGTSGLEPALTAIQVCQLAEADADVFLNVLLSKGDTDHLDTILNELIGRKREVFIPQYLSGTSRDKVVRILDFASESKVTQRQPARVSASYSPKPLSKDLLGKAVQTRSEWARKFGILDEQKSLTKMGALFLDRICQLSERTPSGGAILWPYDYQLASLRLDLKRLRDKIPIPRVWDVSRATAESVIPLNEHMTSFDRETMLNHVHRIFGVFKELSPSRSLLRDKLPASVLSCVFAPLVAAESGAIPDLPTFIEEERKQKNSTLIFVPRTGSEGNFLFRG